MECVYVAQGVGGILKVGRTKNVARRKVSLRKEFRQHGDCLAVFEACAELQCAYGAEYMLINTLRNYLPKHSGREWFARGNFENALRAAREITEYQKENYRPIPVLTPEESAALAARYARLRQEREARVAARKAWVAETKRRAAHRRLLRSGPERAFNTIAGVLLREQATPTPEESKAI